MGNYQPSTGSQLEKKNLLTRLLAKYQGYRWAAMLSRIPDRQIPVFIMNFNRVVLPRRIYESLSAFDGIYPVFLDNRSTRREVGRMYADLKAPVFQSCRNFGHQVIWTTGFDKRLDGIFGLTDPDLDISHCPKDMFDVFRRLLAEHQEVRKVGCALKIDDLPSSKLGDSVREWEGKFWLDPIAENIYRAHIDTTLAMYDGSRKDLSFYEALRVAGPYTAKHLPWYPLPPEIEADETAYLKSTSNYASWKSLIIEE